LKYGNLLLIFTPKGKNKMKTSFLLTLTFFLVSIGCSDKNNPISPSGNNSIKVYLIDTTKIDSNGFTTNTYVRADRVIQTDSIYYWFILPDDSVFNKYIGYDTIPITWKLLMITNDKDTTNKYYETDIYKFFGKELDYPYTPVTDSLGIKYLQ
jgi:hypothetical protein